MHPILLKLGPVTLHSYGVLLATGVLAGLWLCGRRGEAAGLGGERVWNLCIYGILSAMVVAKLWLIFSDWDKFSANPREIFSLSMLQSGGVFYGGFLGGLIVILAGAWKMKIPLLPLLDVVSPSVILGQGIGRLGCFSAGCCYGRPSDVPWAVTFVSEYAHQMFDTPLHIALHPTQLYNAATSFAIFFALLWLDRRQRFKGQIFAALAILYGMARFTTEIYRGDPGRTLLFGDAVSLMQIVSIGLILFGAWLWWRGSQKPVAAKRRPS